MDVSQTVEAIMRLILALSLGVFVFGQVLAQAPAKNPPAAADLDPAIKKADELFAADIAKAEEAFAKAKRAASEERLKVYRDRQKIATKAGNLDQALAIKAAIEALDAVGDGLLPRPKNTVRFQMHSYAFISEPATWNVAKQRCEAMGGHLVTIENPAEFDVVRKFITTQEAWIGGTDEEKEGEWRWVTGPMIPKDFLSRCGIDNHQDSQHALCIGSIGNIVDNCGAFRRFYICEWDK